jgi:hypothetical protein
MYLSICTALLKLHNSCCRCPYIIIERDTEIRDVNTGNNLQLSDNIRHMLTGESEVTLCVQHIDHCSVSAYHIQVRCYADTSHCLRARTALSN